MLHRSVHRTADWLQPSRKRNRATLQRSLPDRTRHRQPRRRAPHLRPMPRSRRRRDPSPRSTPARWATAAARATARAVRNASSNPGHASAANRRARPGAIRRAINAASITIVPDPHIGSRSGRSGVQPLAMRSAAASVSRSGAFATACRYPRRYINGPAASTDIVTSSLITRTTIRCIRPIRSICSSAVSIAAAPSSAPRTDTRSGIAAFAIRSSRSAIPPS